MPVTSGSYNFINATTDQLISDAFSLAGVDPQVLGGLQQVGGFAEKTAIFQSNLMFVQWQNEGVDMWTIERCMLQLVPGQTYYKLPKGTITVEDATVGQAMRQTTGTPFSSSGVAANAFDGNVTTTCTTTDNPVTTPDFIGFNYGDTPIEIWYVGILTYVTATYTLIVEYSYDGTSYLICNTVPAQQYIKGTLEWIVLTAPPVAPYWRVRCIAGNSLNLAELYFMTPGIARGIEPMSGSVWQKITNKNASPTTVTTYWVERRNEPNLIFWPTPSTQYPFFIYRRKRYIQDVDDLVLNMDVPQRFYDAVSKGLGARLALIYNPDKYAMLAPLAREALDVACADDTDKGVGLNIVPSSWA